MLEYFPDILACTTLFPCGVLFSYYLYSPNFSSEILSGIAASGAVAIFLNLRRLCLRHYTFDHMYFLIIGQLSFLVYGIFTIFRDRFLGIQGVALMFGFIGHGITMLVSPVYLSLRTSKDGNRPFRIAFMYAVYFAGVMTRGGIGPQHYIITISAVINLIGLFINEILQIKGSYNYKKSLDQEWNNANETECILKATKDIIEELENSDSIESIVEKNSHAAIVVGLLVVRTENILIFADPIYKKMSEWSQEVGINFQIDYLMIFGSVFAAFLLIFLKPKYVYTICKLIVIVSLSCISYPNFRAVFLLITFIGMQGCYSIIVTSLLETAHFSLTEILTSFGYILEIFAIDFLKKYETSHEETTEFTVFLSLFGVTTLLFIILLYFCLPESKSLLDIKNELIGTITKKEEINQPQDNTRYYPFVTRLQIPISNNV